MTLLDRLATAEEELLAFERQPPLGWRAYQSGRNSRMAVIANLKEQLVAAPEAICQVCSHPMFGRSGAHGTFAYCPNSTRESPHPTISMPTPNDKRALFEKYPWFEKFAGKKCGICDAEVLPREGQFGGFMFCPGSTREYSHGTWSAEPQDAGTAGSLSAIGTGLKYDGLTLESVVDGATRAYGVTITPEEAFLMGESDNDTNLSPAWMNNALYGNPDGDENYHPTQPWTK